MIAPSDMMDGRIGLIRKSLDKKNSKIQKYYLMLLNMLQTFMDHLEMLLVLKKLKGIKKLIKWI